MVSMRIPMSEVEGHEQEKAEVDEMVMALDPVPQVVVVRCDEVKENAMWHDGKGRGNESEIESVIGSEIESEIVYESWNGFHLPDQSTLHYR